MRLLRIVIALAFALAMAGAAPQSAACTHHADSHSHHQDAHGSAPQACCPAAVTVSLHTPAARWIAAPAPVLFAQAAQRPSLVLPSRPRALPFALAPPPASRAV